MSGKVRAAIERNERRPTLDRALAGPAFRVDQIACAGAAQAILDLKADGGVQPRLPDLGREILFRLCQAAICHQMNWDFLGQRLALAFSRFSISVDSLRSVNARDIAKWLEGYDKPERIRAPERSAILRNVGEVLAVSYDSDARKLIQASNRRLVGSGGFLSRLDEFESFREDPLRKKSNILTHELVRDDLARFIDEDQIAPAIDYHIMRLHLRTGRVIPIHVETMQMLRSDTSPRLRMVTLLRKAVSESLSLTSFYANLPVPVVNTVEWQIGREICDRVSPKCEEVPAHIREMLGSIASRCPYSGFCTAFSAPEWRDLREPDLNKSFY